MTSSVPPDSPVRALNFYECVETCQLREVAKRIGEAVGNFFIAIAKGIYSGLAWVYQKITCSSEDTTSESPPEMTYLSPLPALEPSSTIPRPATQAHQSIDHEHLATMSAEDRAAINAALCDDDRSAEGGTIQARRDGRVESPPSSLARATASQRRRSSQLSFSAERSSGQRTTPNHMHLDHPPTPSEFDTLLRSGQSVQISFPSQSYTFTSGNGRVENTITRTTRDPNGTVKTTTTTTFGNTQSEASYNASSGSRFEWQLDPHRQQILVEVVD